MSENSKIQWTDNTGGPWLGCTEVSPGCANCYARELTMARLARIMREAYRLAGLENWETRPVWGKTAPRVITKGFWKAARRMNKKCICSKCDRLHDVPAGDFAISSYRCGLKIGGRVCGGELRRIRMFPSMIDWLDEMPAGIMDQAGEWADPDDVRAQFMGIVRECQNLDWLLLTKRPEAFKERFAQMYSDTEGEELSDWLLSWYHYDQPPRNVWVGVSVEDQARADLRRSRFQDIAAFLRFVSYEPALEEVDWSGWEFIDWLIAGGESGCGARSVHVNAFDAARRFCEANEISFFMKQLGAHPRFELPGRFARSNPDWARLKDPKGGDPSEWPEHLRVRQFPEVER